MDQTIVILIVILMFVLGIYGISQLGGESGAGNVARSGNSYPTQYSGGGCGR